GRTGDLELRYEQGVPDRERRQGDRLDDGRTRSGDLRWHAVHQFRLRRHRRPTWKCAARVWSRIMKKLFVVVAFLSAAAFVRAQPPAPTGLIVGSGNFFSPIVSDLDKAIAFYRDGIGLDITGNPSNAD